MLLVAEKYQTGFDQPLLHTMYVDKRLAGIQAVQTLSRLNRVTPARKTPSCSISSTSANEIFDAFKPYYETTPVGEPADPHQLYDLQHELGGVAVFEDAEIDEFCEVWFSNRESRRRATTRRLHAVLDRPSSATRRWPRMTNRCSRVSSSFRALYAFLSQIIPYQDSDLEKLYTYGAVPAEKLPLTPDEDGSASRMMWRSSIIACRRSARAPSISRGRSVSAEGTNGCRHRREARRVSSRYQRSSTS